MCGQPDELLERLVPTELIIPPEATDHNVAWDRRHDQCDFLCGFQSSRDVPYRTMVFWAAAA